MKRFEHILKRVNILLIALLVFAPKLIAQYNYDGGVIRFTDGQIVHVVPVAVASQALDALFRSPGNYRLLLQVGTFAVKENAVRLRQKLELDGYNVTVKQYYAGKDLLYYLVYVGAYASVDEARQKLRDIKTAYNLEGLLLAQGRAKL